jgi:hypothetical protein
MHIDLSLLGNSHFFEMADVPEGGVFSDAAKAARADQRKVKEQHKKVVGWKDHALKRCELPNEPCQ